jgi:septal ring-binding cell division protein DamX
MAKDPTNSPRFLSDATAKPLQLSFYPRQVVMVGCALLASALLLFSSGVVVGRWYSASAVEATPSLSALDEQAKPQAAAVMPKLSFHEVLPLPLPVEPEEIAVAELKPEALEDQDPLPAKAAAKPTPKPAEAPKKVAEPAKPAEAKKVAEAPKANVLAATQKDTKLTTKPESKKGTFTLQVGIFSSKKEAEALVKKLKSSGEKPFMSTSESTGAYIVRIGTYPNLDDAKTGQKAFKNRSGMSAMIASK